MTIGGNTEATIQVKTSKRTEIGAFETVWSNSMTLHGWLDLSGGDSKYSSFNAKVQESTHIFLCDYQKFGGITSENARMVIDGRVYDVLLIDNPMGMNDHLEIYLRFVGGQ